MTHEIKFWSNSSYSNKVLNLQKRVLGINTGSMSKDSCRDLFKNLNMLTLPSQYIFPLLCFIITNRDQHMFNSGIHGINARQVTNFLQPISNLSLYQKRILNMDIKT